MRRQARLERRVIIELADGSTVTFGPGVCWLDEGGEEPMFTWETSGGEQLSSPIEQEVVARHLARRDLVYVSW